MRKPWMVVRWVHRGVYANYTVEPTMTAAELRAEWNDPAMVIVSKHATEQEALDIVAGRGSCTCLKGRLGDRIGLDCPRCAHERKLSGGM